MHDQSSDHPSPSTRHRPSRPTVFAAAFVAGAVAAFGMNTFFDARVRQTRPVVECEPIFVALRSLPQGAPVTVWDVGLRDWPRAMLPATALRAADRFEGLLLRHPLREGQPLLAVQLAEPAPTEQAVPQPAWHRQPSRSGAEPTPIVEEFAAPLPVAKQAEEPDPEPSPPQPEASNAEPATRPVVDSGVESGAAVASSAEPEAALVAQSPATGMSLATGSREPPTVPELPLITGPDPAPDPARVPEPAAEPEATDGHGVSAARDSEPESGQRTVAESAEDPETKDPSAAVIVVESEPAGRPGTAVEAGSGSESASVIPSAVSAAPVVASASPIPALADDVDPRIARSDSDPPSAAAAAVLPLPAVDPPARIRIRPPVPPTPSSDIASQLAVLSRQRAARTTAPRADGAIATTEKPRPSSAPAERRPASDVSGARTGLATVPPAVIADSIPEPLIEGSEVGEPEPADSQVIEEVPAATARERDPDQAHSSIGVPAMGLPGVAEPESQAAPVVPLRHLVVPERIAMQAELSFVAAEPPLVTEPVVAGDEPASQDHLAGESQPVVEADPGPSRVEKARGENRPTRPQAPGSAPRDGMSAEGSNRGEGPVMRAIGSLFQGFSSPANPPPQRR